MHVEQQDTLLKGLAEQGELYRPSIFWAEASNDILEQFSKEGIEGFRSQINPLLYFVPTYGNPGNGIPSVMQNALQTALDSENVTIKQQAAFDSFLNGKSQALADYRVLQAANFSSPYKGLLDFSESHVGKPLEQFEFDEKFYSRSALNYLMGLSFFNQFADLTQVKSVMEIGGGFGTLGEIIQKVLPESKYIDIDIPPTLFASDFYLRKVFGDTQVTSVEDYLHLENLRIDELAPISVLPSWKIEALQGQVDLFVNFISFQEMEPHIVQNYLNHVCRLHSKWVLLRNMREGKQTRKQHRVGVEKPIFSEDYVKMLPDYELVATNVVPFGFKTTDNFHSELMLFKLKNTHL